MDREEHIEIMEALAKRCGYESIEEQVEDYLWKQYPASSVEAINEAVKTAIRIAINERDSVSRVIAMRRV